MRVIDERTLGVDGVPFDRLVPGDVCETVVAKQRFIVINHGLPGRRGEELNVLFVGTDPNTMSSGFGVVFSELAVRKLNATLVIED